jgi:hypothetical protein
MKEFTMGMVLVSSKPGFENYVLKVGFPVGTAILEIDGASHHLNKPYFFIRYLEPGSTDKSYAGYEISGWMFGIHDDNLTTAKLLKVLRRLGFSMSAHTLREEILKGAGVVDSFEIKEENKGNVDNHDEAVSLAAG